MRQTVRIPLLVLITGLLLAITLSAGAQEGRPSPVIPNEQSNGIVIYMPVFYKPAKQLNTGDGFDLAEFMIGDGRLYEVWRSVNNSQARHQTQVNSGKFFHTKGDENYAEWEELWATDKFIYRGTDTSPGSGQYYTLREYGQNGSPWAPRFWKVGKTFERNPRVTFYWKSNCNVVYDNGEPVDRYHRTWLKFEDYHPTFTFPSGITLEDVVQFAWLLSPGGQPIERYYYARSYGLVGWSSNDRGFSHISEIHAFGTRPDNKRETIGCLSTSAYPEGMGPLTPVGILPPPYIYRVK
jgi:hypothetical protein